MPIYEYVCKACRKPFEQLIRNARDERQVACPHCGKQRAERRLSLPAAPRSLPAVTAPRAGGCGRCGDPQGPCSIG